MESRLNKFFKIAFLVYPYFLSSSTRVTRSIHLFAKDVGIREKSWSIETKSIVCVNRLEEELKRGRYIRV